MCRWSRSWPGDLQGFEGGAEAWPEPMAGAQGMDSGTIFPLLVQLVKAKLLRGVMFAG